ncbi:MAG: Undecaprenyl phosphate-alpha-4-amino-4-deoxy-L-arabinose arabinosyl transferase, partial [Planctomycetota bacterium]
VASRYLPDEGWLGYFGFVPGVAGLIACLFVQRDAREWAVRTCSVAAIVFATCFFGVGTVAVDRHQENHRLLAALPAVDQGADVFSLGTLEPSWVFYSKRPIRELVAQRNEPSNQRAISGGYAKSPTTFAEFLGKKHDCYVITTRRQFDALPDAFREDMQCLIEVPLFLKSEDLVLLRRRPVEPVSVAGPLARPIDGPISPNSKR